MTPDQNRILELISGRRVHPKRGLRRTAYLKEGCADELEARRALARELRKSSPLDLGVRLILADMVDPDCDAQDRRIVFKRRRKGKPSNAAAEKEVAEFIWSLMQEGGRKKVPISLAGEKFGLKPSRVKKVWSEWQPILKRPKRH